MPVKFNSCLWNFIADVYNLKDDPQLTWIASTTPSESILLAMLTVSPHTSYCGFWAPTTPAITGPWLKPKFQILVLFSASQSEHEAFSKWTVSFVWLTYPELKVVERVFIYTFQHWVKCYGKVYHCLY